MRVSKGFAIFLFLLLPADLAQARMPDPTPKTNPSGIGETSYSQIAAFDEIPEEGGFCDKQCRRYYYKKLNIESGNRVDMKKITGHATDSVQVGQSLGIPTVSVPVRCDCNYAGTPMLDSAGRKIGVVRDQPTANSFSSQTVALAKQNPRAGMDAVVSQQREGNPGKTNLEKTLEANQKNKHGSDNSNNGEKDDIQIAMACADGKESLECRKTDEAIAKFDEAIKKGKENGEPTENLEKAKQDLVDGKYEYDSEKETMVRKKNDGSGDAIAAAGPATDPNQNYDQYGNGAGDGTGENGDNVHRSSSRTEEQGNDGSLGSNDQPGGNGGTGGLGHSSVPPDVNALITDPKKQYAVETEDGWEICEPETGSSYGSRSQAKTGKGTRQQNCKLAADIEKERSDLAAAKANKPRRGFSHENDACGSTIDSMLIKRAVEDLGKANPSRDEVLAHIESNMHLKTEIKQKYGCTVDMKKLRDSQNRVQGYQMGAQILSGGIQGYAVGSAQQAASDPTKNVHREANNAMGNAMIATGITQALTGAGQMSEGVMVARKIESKHENAVSDIESYDTRKKVARSGNTQTETDLTQGGLVASALDGANARAGEEAAAMYNAQGGSIVGEAHGTHQALAEEAGAVKASTYIQSAMNLFSGAMQITMGYMTRCKDGDARPQCAGPQASPPPPLIGGFPEQVAGAGSVPVPVPSVGGGNDASPVVAEGLDALDDQGFDEEFPLPPGGGGGGGNSLLQNPGAHKGNLVAGTGSGNSGGGVGGGGGLGGNSSSPKNAAGAEKTLLASGKKYGDVVGGGGAGFGTAGGGARRSDNTNMGLGGLFDKLGAMLPNNRKDQKADSSILDFGTRGIASAGGERDGDDGSILGRNSNLFLRISNTTMTYYKKGFLK